jgi:acetyltransferase EpsM
VTHTTRPLLVLGTRTLAVEIADIAADIPGVRVAGFVENLNRERCQEKLEDLPVLWVDDLAPLAQSHKAVCGLATTHRSRFVAQVAVYGIPFATVIHPLARISSKSAVSEGSILSVGVIVAACTHLGRHVLVNRGALIGHHTEIGEATYIGMGAIVIDHITIGSHSVIGAGAVVTTDVPDHVLVVGMPARVVKENIPGK